MPDRNHVFLALCILAIINIAVPATAQWVDGGTPVCQMAYDQKYPSIAGGPEGSAYIAWADFRSGSDWKIYIQRVARSGHLMWMLGSVQVCAHEGDQRYPAVYSDGFGGVVVIWQDERTGSDGVDLYAQRFDLDGNPLWSLDGVPVAVAPGDQVFLPFLSPTGGAAPDGTGGVIVLYSYDNGSDRDVYAQRINGTGSRPWGPLGVPVATGANDQDGLNIITDGSGGAILGFTEELSDTSVTGCVQRVDSLGTLLWEGGRAFISGMDHALTAAPLVPDGAGGIFVFWGEYRGTPIGSVIYAHRFDGSGVKVWGEDEVSVISWEGTQFTTRAVSDGAGGAIVSFYSCPFSSCTMEWFDIYSQRIDAMGTTLWGDTCVAVSKAGGQQYPLQDISDDEGGVIIAWVDGRRPSNFDTYIQRIGTDGPRLWSEEGIRVTSALGLQYVRGMISDGEGGAILVWDDMRDGHWDIYAQRINDSGNIVATTLAHMSSSVDAAGVRLEWILSEEVSDAVFAIARKDGPGAEWKYIEDADVSMVHGSYIFEDESVKPGGIYSYRIDIEDKDGYRFLFETEELAVPKAALTLYQNHPNPFNPSTTIRFYLPEKCPVRLEVFDVSGRRVRCLADESMDKGTHTLAWNGQDAVGNTAASGVYFYRLTAGKNTISKKMILLR